MHNGTFIAVPPVELLAVELVFVVSVLDTWLFVAALLLLRCRSGCNGGSETWRQENYAILSWHAPVISGDGLHAQGTRTNIDGHTTKSEVSNQGVQDSSRRASGARDKHVHTSGNVSDRVSLEKKYLHV